MTGERLGHAEPIVESTAFLLALSSCATAIIHALIPDHWLPFALMARAQRWSDRRTFILVALTGAIHVTVSIALGFLLAAAGRSGARRLAAALGTSLPTFAGALMVLFGVGYGLWAHRREARAHLHGQARGEPDVLSEPLHAHGHLLSRLTRGTLTGGALVAVIGISPCVLLQPILFAAASEGTGAAAAVALAFAIGTIGTMILVTLVATRGLRLLRLSFFTRFGDLLSGLVIAAIGLVMLLRGDG
jgi:nickel/cobalt transporter (NicO) family protein